MKFFYLYLVGLLNLALGWGAARWLNRAAAPVKASQPEASEQAPASRETQQEETHQAAAEEPLVPAPPETAAVVAGPIAALEELTRELGKKSEQFEKTGKSLAADHRDPEELKATAAVVDESVKSLLATLNRAVDALADTSARPLDTTADQVELCWEDVNAEAVQLLTLAFDDANVAASRKKLAAVCGELSRVCSEAQEAFGNVLECHELAAGEEPPADS